MNKFLFRLRINEKIVGYKKFMSSKLYFFSKDLYGFSSKEISYNNQDLFSGFFSKNNNQIFENDILKDKNNKMYLIFSNNTSTNLHFFSLNNNNIIQISKNNFSKISKTLTHLSYLFINKQIHNQLNIKEINYDI